MGWRALHLTSFVASFLFLGVAWSKAQTAPSITTQPVSESVAEGGSVSFTVEASGSATLTYQWYLDGTPVTGATNTTLALKDVQSSDAGTYTVVAANSVNTATSDGAVLTVIATPEITAIGGNVSGFLAIPFQLTPTISNSPTSVTVSGLPPGLTADPKTGIISGTPTTLGTYTVTLTASNSDGNGTSDVFIITIEFTPLVFTPVNVGNQQFHSPSGLAINSQGDVYVADTGDNILCEVTPAGVVTVLAGTSGQAGSSDGLGSAALFSSPTGLAIDSDGNLYVTDTANNTIRKVTSTGEVSTLAGTPGMTGSQDGRGIDASFNAPTGIAIDASGKLYVADSANDEIRLVSSTGEVTTFAGAALQANDIDAFGIGARFNDPTGIAVNSSGNIDVLDLLNRAVREITPSGGVTTFFKPALLNDESLTLQDEFNGVAADASGNIYITLGPAVELSSHSYSSLIKVSPAAVVTDVNDWVTSEMGRALAIPTFVTGVAIDPSGVVYILVNGVLEKSSLAVGTSISTQPQSQNAVGGQNVTFSVSATGNPTPSYQWQFNGADITGATSSTLTLNNVTESETGNYSVTVNNGYSTVTSAAADLSVSGTLDRLVNISTRAQVGTGANILIPGFIISGSGTETLLIRADGPSLAQFGVTGFLAAPSLSVFDDTGKVIATNTVWGTNTTPTLIASTATSVGAFALASGSADCALIVSLPAGAYTAQISGVNNTEGIALAEIYEVSSSGTRLTNISTRAQVGTGANVLIPGFVVSGNGHEQLLVRADGPSLAQFGIAGFLTQPTLSVFDNTGNAIASNSGWSTGTDPALIASTSSAVGAFSFATGSRDSAQIVTLTNGAYTMLISGPGGSTGVALAEIYEVSSSP